MSDTVENKQLWLSASRINAYKSCGLYYKFNYIDKIDTGIKGGYHTALGSGIHKCLEELYKGNDKSLQFLERMWNTVCYKGYVEKNGIQVLPIVKDTQYDFIDSDETCRIFFYHGRKLLRLYYEEHKEEIIKSSKYTIEVELNFKIPVGKDGNIVLNGYIDRIDIDENGGITVVDYKTGKVRTQESVDEDLQLTLYALAIRKTYGVKEKSLCLDFVKTRNRIHTTRTKEHFDKLLSDIKFVKNGIENKEFEPRIGDMCKYCYFDCPIDGNKKKEKAEKDAELKAFSNKEKDDIVETFEFITKEDHMNHFQDIADGEFEW